MPEHPKNLKKSRKTALSGSHDPGGAFPVRSHLKPGGMIHTLMEKHTTDRAEGGGVRACHGLDRFADKKKCMVSACLSVS